MMKNILISIFMLGSISFANEIDESQTGKYQILWGDPYIYVLDTANGDLFARTEGWKKKYLTSHIDSKLSEGPIGTYQFAYLGNEFEFFSNQLFLINTATAEVYKSKKGKWRLEKFKKNDIADNR